MSPWSLAGLGLTSGYILGSIPASYLICLWGWGVDLRKVGSGNPGATNALRSLGPKAGIPALVLDAGKGVLAVLIARELSVTLWNLHPVTFQLACGLMAVVGHTFPLFLGFKGGKGVATAAGVMLTLSPVCVGLSVLVFGVTVTATRYVSLASMIAASSFPLFTFFLVRDARGPLVGLSTLLAAFIIYRHRDNVRRLLDGSENKLGSCPQDPMTEISVTTDPADTSACSSGDVSAEENLENQSDSVESTAPLDPDTARTEGVL